MNLFEQIVDTARGYLGPVAEMFVRRQLVNHLGVAVETFGPQHAHDLAERIRESAALIMDRAKAEDLARAVEALAQRRAPWP